MHKIQLPFFELLTADELSFGHLGVASTLGNVVFELLYLHAAKLFVFSLFGCSFVLHSVYVFFSWLQTYE